MTHDTQTAAREAAAADAANEARRLCATLTPAQRDELILACKGLKVQAAATVQGLSYHTVDRHRTALRKRLGVNSMVEAAVIAGKAGLL